MHDAHSLVVDTENPGVAMPDRSDRMDDPACGQVEAGRNAGLAGGAAYAGRHLREGAAGCQKVRPGCPVDGSVHATAAKQGGVGGIDDGIHLQVDDVGGDHGD